MSFMDEVKSTIGKSKVATPVPVAVVTPVDSKQVQQAEPPAVIVAGAADDPTASPFDLPTGTAPVNPETPIVATEAIKAEPAVVAAEPAKKLIKIGDKEFDKVEDAIAHAQAIEAAALQDKAYVQGVLDSQKKPELTAEQKKDFYEQFAEKFFQDPVAATKELSEKVKEDLRVEYNTNMQTQTAAQAAEVQKQNAWESFFKANPDLSEPETRDIVQNYVTTKNWNDIKDLSTEKGFEKIAELSRKTLKIAKQAALPTTILSSSPVTTTGAAGELGSGPTQAKTQEKSDFVSEWKQAFKRTK